MEDLAALNTALSEGILERKALELEAGQNQAQDQLRMHVIYALCLV